MGGTDSGTDSATSGTGRATSCANGLEDNLVCGIREILLLAQGHQRGAVGPPTGCIYVFPTFGCPPGCINVFATCGHPPGTATPA